MKTTGKLLIFVFTFLTLSASAYAQSPREDLQQMVEQLQKTPNDNALREKIIKLAPTLKPAPVLPDTAVAFEGRAQFAFRSAKSEGDYLVAAQEYEKAVAAAPWVPGYYADLCTIYEKAGKFEDAKRHCGFYLIGLTDPAQMTDVKRRIAGLEFGIEKSTNEETEKSRRPNFKGIWRKSGDTSDAPDMNSIEIIEDSSNRWRVGRSYDVNATATSDTFSYDFVSDVKISGRQLSFRIRVQLPGDVYPMGYFDCSLTQSEDGSRLTGHWVYIQRDTSRGLGRNAERGRVPVVFIR